MQNCGLIRSLYQCHSTINSHKISVHELTYQCPWPSVDWQITRATRGSELVKLNLSPCVSRKLVVHGTSTLLYATADSWWVYFIELRWGTCHNIARTLRQGPHTPNPTLPTQGKTMDSRGWGDLLLPSWGRLAVVHRLTGMFCLWCDEMPGDGTWMKPYVKYYNAVQGKCRQAHNLIIWLLWTSSMMKKIPWDIFLQYWLCVWKITWATFY